MNVERYIATVALEAVKTVSQINPNESNTAGNVNIASSLLA